MAKGRHRSKKHEQPTSAPLPPASPQMKQAWKHFESGDKLTARREAKAVLAGNPGEEDARQARELIDRTRLPPIALYTAAAAALIIVSLIVLAAVRGP